MTDVTNNHIIRVVTEGCYIYNEGNYTHLYALTRDEFENHFRDMVKQIEKELQPYESIVEIWYATPNSILAGMEITGWGDKEEEHEESDD